MRCAQEIGTLHNCTVAEEDDFCRAAPHPHPPTPEPNHKCYSALDLDCGKERRNHTGCLACTEEHRAGLEAANCSLTEISAFCEPRPPVPPAGRCEELYEADCGTDRHNESLCVKCMEAHTAVFHEHNCTDHAAEEAFCRGPPAPPAPTAECAKVLDEFCEADKHNRTLCLHCEALHHNQTRKAGCSYTQLEEFCRPAPVPPHPTPSSSCPEELRHFCDVDRTNKTKCVRCIEANTAALEKAGCTQAAEEEFCGIHPEPPAPGSNCSRVFMADCGNERKNHTQCMQCAEEHRAGLEAARCTVVEIDRLCEAPRPPNASCYETLKEDCEADVSNKTKCLICGREHEKVCEYTEIEHFCHVTPAPPTPGPPRPGEKCYKELYTECEAVKADETKCLACGEEHKVAGNCTGDEIDRFCHKQPTPTPGVTCPHVFEEECGVDRHNKTLCLSCMRRHNETILAHKCTMEAADAFCEGARPGPAPAPNEECGRLLTGHCEADRKSKTLCMECITKHQKEDPAPFAKAKCTYAEEEKFCTPPPAAPKMAMWSAFAALF